MITNQDAVTQVVQYIKDHYDREPEFLWARTPKDAVFRHRGSLKWFAAILHVLKQKLHVEAEGDAVILDVKCDPNLISSLLDNKNYFPAYHMNKEHWITIVLDDEVKLDEVFALIDFSYHITEK